MTAAVLGSGAWGTTFAQVLCDAGTPTTLLCRRPELALAINQTHQSPDYLPGITLPGVLRATTEPAEALAGADLVVFAIPAQSLRENLASWRDLLQPDALLVSLMKGIELGTGDRMSQVIAESDGRRSGPDRRRLRAESGAGDRGQAILRHRGRLCRRGGRGTIAEGLPLRLLPAVHQHRRDRL